MSSEPTTTEIHRLTEQTLQDLKKIREEHKDAVKHHQEMYKRVYALEDGETKLKKQTADYKAQVLEVERACVEQHYKPLQQTVDTVKATAEGLQAKVESYHTDCLALDKRVDSNFYNLQSKIRNGVEIEVAGAKAGIERLDEQYQEVMREVNSHQSSIGGLRSDVRDLFNHREIQFQRCCTKIAELVTPLKEEIGTFRHAVKQLRRDFTREMKEVHDTHTQQQLARVQDRYTNERARSADLKSVLSAFGSVGARPVGPLPADSVGPANGQLISNLDDNSLKMAFTTILTKLTTQANGYAREAEVELNKFITELGPGGKGGVKIYPNDVDKLIAIVTKGLAHFAEFSKEEMTALEKGILEEVGLPVPDRANMMKRKVGCALDEELQEEDSSFPCTPLTRRSGRKKRRTPPTTTTDLTLSQESDGDETDEVAEVVDTE